MLPCVNCHKTLNSSNYYHRHDRTGFYRMCKPCMVEQGRSIDHPPVRERGNGNLNLVIGV